ncbi:hypothetical protein HNQ07_001855 [Deinococcus metalli]|uniref:DUF2846 domain-containing protein n=1 Tax=Deinococcus metalli TaxID=1141878 RepID=A0A7W8KDZ3_9DEIO|nr:hypothetical protein [Deinococcus metalli]MBB5376391.1 hypothetical protein [Deinococcus metalli]GHF44412.1 hypothetical protein GCM10017781_21140 [Deinococcus metalli]
MPTLPVFPLRSALRPAVVALALLVTASLGGPPHGASAQGADAPTQTLVINYPNPGVPSGAAGSALYKGLVYVTIVPAGASAPVATSQLSPSQRDVRALPLGTYEVRFAVRSGSELKTFILRDVILRSDRANAVSVEVNLDAKTTVVGGDMSAQQMAALIRQLQAQVAALQQQLAALTPK